MSTIVNASWARDVAVYPPRKAHEIQWVVIHRIEVSQEDPAFDDTPAGIERFFAEHPVGVGATGGRMPYAILIDAGGVVTQSVPLDRIAPHVRHHNPAAVGVGCIGDFRGRAPTAAQYRALIEVCADLLDRLGLDPAAALVGHDELSEASADPNKECPGAELGMADLRRDVAATHARRLELV